MSLWKILILVTIAAVFTSAEFVRTPFGMMDNSCVHLLPKGSTVIHFANYSEVRSKTGKMQTFSCNSLPFVEDESKNGITFADGWLDCKFSDEI